MNLTDEQWAELLAEGKERVIRADKERAEYYSGWTVTPLEERNDDFLENMILGSAVLECLPQEQDHIMRMGIQIVLGAAMAMRQAEKDEGFRIADMSVEEVIRWIVEGSTLEGSVVRRFAADAATRAGSQECQ